MWLLDVGQEVVDFARLELTDLVDRLFLAVLPVDLVLGDREDAGQTDDVLSVNLNCASDCFCEATGVSESLKFPVEAFSPDQAVPERSASVNAPAQIELVCAVVFSALLESEDGFGDDCRVVPGFEELILLDGFEVRSLDLMEPTLKYHPGVFEVPTLARDPGWGQCMVGHIVTGKQIGRASCRERV